MVAMPASKQRACSHVSSIDIPHELIKGKRQLICQACPKDGQKSNNWLCLHLGCAFVGCGENKGKGADHSGQHYKTSGHCVALNLRNWRMWCYKCLHEVHHTAVTSLKDHSRSETEPRRVARQASPPPLLAERGFDVDVEVGSELLPQGLMGLRNLGNTCYMNAALQALSNCPQLTVHLLHCGLSVANVERNGVTVSLAESFANLIRRLWFESRVGMVSPTELTSAVKAAMPTFRGYAQQDSQEFLRCFMDRLHEEMKEPVLMSRRRRRHRDSEELADEEDSCGDDSDESDDGASEDFEEDVDSVAEASDAALGAPAHEADDGEGGRATAEAGGDGGESDAVSLSDATVDAEDGLTQQHPAGDHAAEAGTASSARGAAKRRSPSCSGSASPLANPPKRKKVTQYRSIISDIFDGKVLSSVQCRTCERISSRKETFQDLSLPIPSREHVAVLQSRSGDAQAPGGPAGLGRSCNEMAPVSSNSWLHWLLGLVYSIFSVFVGPNIALQDCLSAFFSEDELDGDNMYSCEKCKKLRNGRKYARLLRLPEILCVHLKRFRHDLRYSSKISTTVSFPLEGLDVSPYLARSAQASGHTLYDLVAMVVHSGTAGGGHYIAYALNRPSGRWFEYDDETVTEVSPQVVAGAEAYVLFYSKRQSDEVAHQRKMREQLTDSMSPDSNKSLMRFYISTAWLAKYETFSDPGPVSNDDFLCRHGAVRPDKEAVLDHLVKELSEHEWNFYHRNFGGGPVATHLHICATCKERELRLQHRQDKEWMVMLKLNNEFQTSPSSNIYAINRRWFISWERFARGKTREPPGPIDNSSIVYTRNGQLVLRQTSGYGHISEAMWDFLHRRYGGGPAMISVSQRLQLSRHASPAQAGGPHTRPARAAPERKSEGDGEEEPREAAEEEREEPEVGEAEELAESDADLEFGTPDAGSSSSGSQSGSVRTEP